jgi:hypothetical protein
MKAEHRAAVRRLASLCVVLSVTSLSGGARAQAAPPAESATADAANSEDARKKEEAKERFLRGLELAQRDDWDAALAEFEASRAIFPTRAALRNAAVSLRNLKRYADAIQMYEELVASLGKEMSEDEKKKTDEAIAELRAYVGEFDVTSDQAGATVVIDGKQYGTTPLPRRILVNSGTHTLRVSKEGFETFEATLTIAGKQVKNVSAPLKALSKSGTLIVNEASGKTLDVVVDGAVVGKTPFRGVFPIGRHSVLLRGEGDLGSLPGSAEVLENQTATLSLSATKLDAEVRVEPVPASARVDVDGQNVGAGIWQGRLTSGSHRLEVYAEGHVPYRKEFTLRSGGRETLRVALERDFSNPMWKVGFRPHPYLELFGGGAFAFSFGGDADASCGGRKTLPLDGAGEGCPERSRPLGFLAGARGGYQLTGGLGLELTLGYVYLGSSMTRRVVLEGEDGVAFESSDYEDETTLSAPLAGIGVSYRFFEKTPLVARLTGGVLRAEVKTSVHATVRGEVPHPTTDDVALIEQALEVPEDSQSLWIPFVAPEVRFGYAISKHVTVDIGVAALLAFGPSSPREGGTFGDRTRRQVALDEVPEGYAGVDASPADGVDDDVRPGVLSFPEEDALGTFVGLVPTLGVRIDF